MTFSRGPAPLSPPPPTTTTTTSGFDTVLTTYTNTGALATLGGAFLGSNDDCFVSGAPLPYSCLTLPVAQGAVVAVQVGGKNGQVGALRVLATFTPGPG